MMFTEKKDEKNNQKIELNNVVALHYSGNLKHVAVRSETSGIKL